jgi:hypothetical protein
MKHIHIQVSSCPSQFVVMDTVKNADCRESVVLLPLSLKKAHTKNNDKEEKEKFIWIDSD